MATKQRKGASDASTPSNPPVHRLNVRIKPAAYQRLQIHCVMSGKAPGEFLESLIETHCRTWRVQENPATRVTADDRLSGADHISQSALAQH
jgi:hypothetical protein